MNFAYVQPSKIAGRSRYPASGDTCAPGRMPKCGERRDAQEPPYLHGGFTLLEVLIAIVVLSIGLLGLAGLQAAGLRNNNSAYMRTMATQQAYDMADRMRANRVAVLAGAYDNISGTGTNPDCITTGCTTAHMAQHDTFEWNTLNAALLPSGKGTVKRIGTSNRFTVIVMWDDARTGATGTACGSDPKVDLTCFTTSFEP